MPKTSDAKARLMEAVSELIWSSSYGATSVDSICERAGVKKGSFYYFFRSKSDLAVAALEEDWKQKKANYDALFSPLTSPLNRLKNYFESISSLTNLRRKRERGWVLGCPMSPPLGSEDQHARDPAIRGKVQEILENRIKYIELGPCVMPSLKGSIKVRDPKAKASARAIFALLPGGTHPELRIQDDLEPIAELKRSVFEVVGNQRDGTNRLPENRFFFE